MRERSRATAPGWLASIGWFAAILVSSLSGSAAIDFEALAAFDRAVTSRMHPQSPWRHAMTDLTALGSGAVATWLTTITGIWLLIQHRVREVCQITLAAAGAWLWIEFLKPLFDRDRPDTVLALAWADGQSFPSGHALIAAAVYLTLARILAARAATATRAVVWSAALVTIAIVAVSRVYLRVHFASDVIGGVLVGALWAACVAALVRINPGRADP